METKEVESPRGRSVTLEYREDTNDLSIIASTFHLWGSGDDEYGLADIHSDGLLLDIGAHIGTVSVAFLMDNPNAHAIAVEPFAENIAVMEANAQRAGVTDRLRIIEGGIGTTTIQAGPPGIHRFVGNQLGGGGETRKVPRVDLRTLGKPDIAKIDCEGCEWVFFKSKAAARIPLILGEYHGRPFEDVVTALPSHEVTQVTGEGALGTFRAVLR